MKATYKTKHPLAVAMLFCFFLITGILTCNGKDMRVYATTTLSGSGAKDDPYIIKDSEDLWTFAELVTEATEKNACAKVADGVTEIDTTVRGEQTGQKWKPICTSIYGNLYTGVFDGNGATIKIDADRGVNNNSGLFGVLGDGGEIRNVTTAGSSKACSYAGGICGTMYSETAKIVNCNNTATVTATNGGAGGLVGCLSKGQILSDASLSNTGAVTSTCQVGGLVGYLTGQSSITVSGSIINTGDIKATFNGDAGGLIGYSSSPLSIRADNDIQNTGTITANGSGQAGGLIGYDCSALSIISYHGMIKNDGSVTSKNSAGGIAGKLSGTGSTEPIQAEKGIQNTAAITGGTYPNSYVGGIFGDYSSSAPLITPDGCIQNTGTVTGTNTGTCVGGVIGLYGSNQKVSNLSNSGTVNGTGSYTGGVIGWWSNLKYGFSDICNIGSVTSSEESTTTLGGIVGKFEGTSITDAYHTNDLPCVGENVHSGSISNCYCLDTNTKALESETKKTAAEFASGVIAYLLDGTGESRNQTLLWGQRLGTDATPVLAGQTVYLNGTTYSNTSASSQSSYTPSTSTDSSGNQETKSDEKTDQPSDTDSSGSSDTAPVVGEVVKDATDGTSYVAKENKDGSLEMAIQKPKDKKQTKIVIPDTVEIGGTSYAVTSIEKNAFKDNKKLSKITIGKNVKAIGANAFRGCTKLKTIKIKSTKLTAKTLSKKAFKGIGAQTIIKVPKEKLATYRKLFRSKGLSSKVKIIGY